jgi:hypothetical protein
MTRHALIVVAMQDDVRLKLDENPFAVGGQASVTSGILAQPDGTMLEIVAKRHAVRSLTLICVKYIIKAGGGDNLATNSTAPQPSVHWLATRLHSGVGKYSSSTHIVSNLRFPSGRDFRGKAHSKSK